MIPFFWTLADRDMAGPANNITNITIGNRFENISAQWGASNVSFNATPDWGRLLWELASIYPDFMGEIAWFILFALPFIMMWLAHADMVPAGLLGVFFGLYVFMFIPDIWKMQAVFMMVIAGVAVIIPLYRRI